MDAYLLRYIFPAAFALLPATMNTQKATALLLAIALQESRSLECRQQIGGPARGFWQFEMNGGVAGVLSHRNTAALARRVCEALRYQSSVVDCYSAIRDNDVLACCFARLLLWTVPGALPGRDDAALGWQQYLAGWRPGKPHSETWDAHYSRAWGLVTGP